MEFVDHFCTVGDGQRAIVRSLQSASRRIVVRELTLDVESALDEHGNTWLSLINAARERGVEVDFMTTFIYSGDKEGGCREFGPSCLPSYILGKLNSNVSLGKTSRVLHEKFILIDDHTLFFGGFSNRSCVVDVGHNICSRNNYPCTTTATGKDDHKHKHTAVFRDHIFRLRITDPGVATYLAHDQKINFVRNDVPRPLCNAHGAPSEQDILYKLISGAQESIYIEIQMMQVSGVLWQSVLERAARAVWEKDRDFQIFIMVPLVHESRTGSLIFEQLHDAYRRSIDAVPGASQHITLFSLKYGDAFTFVHSKLMIVDAKSVWISSSNWSTKSLSPQGDIELGVVLNNDPATVAGLVRKLLSYQAGTDVTSFAQFRDLVHSNTGWTYHSYAYHRGPKIGRCNMLDRITEYMMEIKGAAPRALTFVHADDGGNSDLMCRGSWVYESQCAAIEIRNTFKRAWYSVSSVSAKILGYEEFTHVGHNIIVGKFPFGGLGEAINLKRERNVRAVVSMCEPFEYEYNVIMGAPIKPLHWEHAGIVFHNYPCPDMRASFDLAAAVDIVCAEAALGTVIVHCKAGRGRSALVAACALSVLTPCTTEQALLAIREKRPCVELTKTQQRAMAEWERCNK
jgi:phosphatidylserine/phosphatidylglycerophosphate/cardiolipin synthase-like enzyme